ncbi:MAG: efflux RND transporter periplasmic adaptor subunit [Candidatus Rokubacteria bacterium]|nr:efflux RND transporter periplasmic adaptor subunit [Candidatus Rokubacteria bacterium]
MRRMLKTGLIIAALLAGAVAAYGYLNREEPEKVTVIKPSRLSVEESVTATGKVEASRTVLVTAEPGARIAAVHFREQQYVRKGDLLATIDDTEVVGQLGQHRANLALAESNLANAQVNVQRLRRLYEKGFAARQDVESAERQVDVYRTQIADRKAAIAMLEAKQSRTSIVSPISGIVTRKFVEAGGVVLESNTRVAGQATAIAELAELGSTDFRADVDQADIAKLRIGQRATLQIDAVPQRIFQATAQEIAVASTPDPTGRVRYGVTLSVGKGEGLLKVGMTGTAKFVVATKDRVLALPFSVIIQQGDEETVYVVADGKAAIRRIKTGLQGEDLVEVVSGLSPEDLVIDQGRAKLKNGRRVELVDAKR